MIKRFYKRFLLWALSPALGLTLDEVGSHQTQAFHIKDDRVYINSAFIASNPLKGSQIIDA